MGGIHRFLLRTGSTWKAQLVVESSPDGYEVRFGLISGQEMQEFDQVLSRSAVGDPGLQTMFSGIKDGMQYEYVRMSQDGGRRVFMNNPCVGGKDEGEQCRLVKAFCDFVDSRMRESFSVDSGKIEDVFRP